MEILGICEKYNKARARYFAASASSVAHDAAAQKAKRQADDAATKSSGVSLTDINLRAAAEAGVTPSEMQSSHNAGLHSSPYPLGVGATGLLAEYDRLAENQIMSARGRPDYTKANQYSRMSSTQSGVASTAESQLNEYLARLADLGFKVADSAMYPVIPPMNLRREIVLELNSNSIPSARTKLPSTDTNAPPPDATKPKL